MAMGGYDQYQQDYTAQGRIGPRRLLTASNCAARRGGHDLYSMTSELAGKCAFPLRRKPRRH